MQEYSEWKQGYLNLLMIKDVNTPPGYCLLQVIRPDQPLPSKDVTTKHYVKVDKEIVLFKNLLGTDGIDGSVMHGPAWTTQRPGLRDYDTFNAIHCQKKLGSGCRKMITCTDPHEKLRNLHRIVDVLLYLLRVESVSIKTLNGEFQHLLQKDL
jgi:hypothetical protein